MRTITTTFKLIVLLGLLAWPLAGCDNSSGDANDNGTGYGPLASFFGGNGLGGNGFLPGGGPIGPVGPGTGGPAIFNPGQQEGVLQSISVDDPIPFGVGVTRNLVVMGTLSTGQEVVVLEGPGVDVNFVSNNPGVATVSSVGVVTGVAPGATTASITVTSDGTTLSDTANLTVTATPILLQSVTFEPDPFSVLVGQNQEIQLTGVFDDTSEVLLNPLTTDIDFTSANQAIATVSPFGFVQGVSVGTTTVTAIVTIDGVIVTVSIPITVTGIPFAIELVPVTSALASPDGPSKRPSISDNGRYVAFQSTATDLDGQGALFGQPDIFVKDRQTGQILIVSELVVGGRPGTPGDDGPSVGADLTQVGTDLYIAFETTARLDPVNDIQFVSDIYVARLSTVPSLALVGLELASLDDSQAQISDGATRPAISANGQFVTFTLEDDITSEGDSNSFFDIYRRNLTADSLDLVSVNPAGFGPPIFGNGPSDFSDVSADGQVVVFATLADNFDALASGGSEIYARDFGGPNNLLRASVGDVEGVAPSLNPSISADANFVSFDTNSAFAPGDVGGFSDIYVHNRTSLATEIVSLDAGGNQGLGDSTFSALSGDGRFVIYSSDAVLSVEDVNAGSDVYVHDRLGGSNDLASKTALGGASNGNFLDRVAISADGMWVAFDSTATNLDTPPLGDVLGSVYLAINPVLSP